MSKPRLSVRLRSGQAPSGHGSGWVEHVTYQSLPELIVITTVPFLTISICFDYTVNAIGSGTKGKTPGRQNNNSPGGSTPVSQNLSIWVENDIQMKIIFHSPIKFSRAIFHSCFNKQRVSAQYL